MTETNRSAHYTIAGYYYQFDHSIAKLLDLVRGDDAITIEGIEDIDVHNADETTAIQVKYYENTKYTVDLIREPILLMLKDFKTRLAAGQSINYSLYVHFGNDWGNLERKLTAVEGKDNHYTFQNIVADIFTFFSYQRNADDTFTVDAEGKRIKIDHFAHTDLELTVAEISDFNITIIKAVDNLENQRKNVREKLKGHFKCTSETEVEYYYNNSFAVVADIARKADDRRLERQNFLTKIDNRVFLFNKWYASLKSKDNYLNFLRKKLKAGKALDVKKRKFFFIGREFLAGADYEAAFVTLIKNIISETYELDKAFSTKNRVSTIVLDAEPEQLEVLKKRLDENKISFNDGNEHRTFSPHRFNEDPIVNTTKVDRISKASYQIKIISFSTFKNNWDIPNSEQIKPIDVVLFFSNQDHKTYLDKVTDTYDSYIIPHTKEFCSLENISELFFKLIINDDYFKIITVLPNLIQIEVTNPIKFALKNDNFSIGSYMKITDENQISIIGILQSYKIKDLNSDSPENQTLEKKDPSFVLDIQPVGYMEDGVFVRGGNHITIPPSEVEVANEALLKNIFTLPIKEPSDLKKVFCFGTLSNYSTNEGKLLNVEIDGNKFFNKHIAVVGSTGSGKSCTVAKILQEGIKSSNEQIRDGILNNSHVVIFDLHNEYRSAFPTGRHLTVKDLVLPYWLLNSDELQTFLLGSELEDGNKKTIIKKAIVENKKLYYDGDKESVTYDLPIYFDIKQIQKYTTNLNESKRDRDYVTKWTLNAVDAAIEGIPTTAEFKENEIITVAIGGVDTPIDTTPFLYKYNCVNVGTSQSSNNGQFIQLLTRLDSQLNDERLDFLFKRSLDLRTENLANIIKQFLGQEISKDGAVTHPKTNVTVIDLSGIPFEVLNVTVALISRLIFSFTYYWKKWNESNAPGTSIKNPFLLVYEEAHNYIPKTEENKYKSVREAVERIAKEGRKYGLSAMIVSQRPSEISETILSQCNSFVIMRITNPTDQSYIKRLLPDSLTGITDNLSVLQPREALIIGDSIPVPTLIKVDKVDEDKLPKSNDVKFIEKWRLNWDDMPEIANIITSMTHR